jgi:tol-pal system protein YbgF
MRSLPPTTRWHLGLYAVFVLMAGCASHADFVALQEEVGKLTRGQDQDHKRDELVQRRLQALEGARPAGSRPAVDERDADVHQRMAELTARLRDLETRLARLEEAGTSGETPEPPRQPRATRPQPSPGGVLIPGTPDLTPTSAFNLAYNDYLNGRYELAIAGFQRFLKDYGSSSLAPNAHYWIGESYYSTRDYVRAMQGFERVVHDFPKSEKVAPALFKLGLSAAETGDPARARSYLKRVIEEFPGSDEAKLAKNKLTEVR